MTLKLLAGQMAKLTPKLKIFMSAASLSIAMLGSGVARAADEAPAATAQASAQARTPPQGETPGDPQSGQAKTGTCVACHGLDGNSPNPEWPSLAGQSAEYIQKQLQAFKTGARQNVLMTPMAMPLSEQDMWDLGAYYATQTVKGLEADPSKVNAGQRLYRSGDPVRHIAACGACHGPAGHGNPAAKYPSIHGQHATYLAAQLRAYRDGKRGTDPNQMMRNIAAALSDDQIDAVASYVQGLR
jgi:cytochrome c553